MDRDNDGGLKEPKKPEPVKYTLEQYAEKHKVHPGLVASLSYELRCAGFAFTKVKTEKEWNTLFNKQAKKTYK